MHEALRWVSLTAAIFTIGGCGDRQSAAPAAPASTASPAHVETAAEGPESSVKATHAPSAKAASSRDANALASCATETNAVKRLACFDTFAKANGLAPETTDTSNTAVGKWRTSTDADPLTDKAVHYAMLTADEGSGRYGDSITMMVRCQNTRTEVFINWNTFLGTEGLRVTSRIDKNPAVTGSWTISTDHKASFMPQVAATLKKFEGASSFVVNLTPYSESPITAIFDISNSSDAFKDIRRDCKW